MMRIRFACDVDSWVMFPLPVSPVSMSMSMPSKLYRLEDRHDGRDEPVGDGG